MFEKKNQNYSKLSKTLEKKLSRFDFIDKLKKKFKEAEIYLVGGAVRDLLFGRKIEDYDFVIRKVKKEDLETFLKQQGQVNFVGKTFGILKFFPKGLNLKEPIDIALPRQDFSLLTGSRHDFKIKTDPNLPIEMDLLRRDFTINAMAIRIAAPRSTGAASCQLIDVSNGKQDLKKGIIRAVGYPAERFKEDYSRVLRAIRFACQFDFSIEEKTWKEIVKQAKNLNKIRREITLVRERKFFLPQVIEYRIVPYETMAKELLKSFCFNPTKAIDFYDQSGIFKELMPEVLKMKKCPQPEKYHSEGDVWVHTRLALKNLSSKEFKKQFGNEPLSGELILGVFFHDLGKPFVIKTPEKDKTDRIRFNGHDTEGAKLAEKICERLKFSAPSLIGVDPKKISWLIKSHMIFVNKEIEKIRANTLEKYFFHPYYNGRDLLKLGFVDILASIPARGRPNFKNFKKMLKKIKEIKSLSLSKKGLPKQILDGHEIMKKFSLKPGPEVGKFLKLLREEQLSGRIKTKKEAFDFLKAQIR